MADVIFRPVPTSSGTNVPPSPQGEGFCCEGALPFSPGREVAILESNAAWWFPFWLFPVLLCLNHRTPGGIVGRNEPK